MGKESIFRLVVLAITKYNLSLQNLTRTLYCPVNQRSKRIDGIKLNFNEVGIFAIEKHTREHPETFDNRITKTY